MKIESLKAVDAIPFGSSPAALQGRAKPARQNVNSRAEAEYWFVDAVFRFAANKLVEVSFKTPERLEIDNETIMSGELLRFMRERDPELFEALGFAVAPNLGLAYDLEHNGSWTTAFTQGRWDSVQEANKRMHRTRR